MARSTITEIVENPLAVPFSEYLTKFQLDLLPTLLKEEGVISVRTGVTRRTTPICAVSLTEWESLESHARFVQKSSSGPFFAESAKLTTGPPRIDHYAFEDLSVLHTALHTQLTFSFARKETVLCAESLDNASTFCEISPVSRGLTGAEEAEKGRQERTIVVEWFSYERKCTVAGNCC